MEMRRIRGRLAQLFGLLNRRRREHEFAEEFKSHLAMHIEDNLRAGDVAGRSAATSADQTRRRQVDPRPLP
jgi:hypothetical protein